MATVGRVHEASTVNSKILSTVTDMTAPRVLYRIFNSSDQLLYVGATTNPALRFKDHSLHKRWWRQAAKITLEHFDSVEELNAAEVWAIQTEKPHHNRIHTDEPWKTGARRSALDPGVFQRADGMWCGTVELPPGPDGKRRQRRVYSKDKAEAMDKLIAARAEAAGG